MGIPFECDLCSFRNVAQRDPMIGERKDDYTLICIRRALLDAFWSRAASTVESNMRRLALDYTMGSAVLSVAQPLPRLGNPNIEDRVGLGVALYTLQTSLRQGRYANHLQWDAMRKTPTWYRSAFDAGSEYSNQAVFANDDKKVYLTTCPASGKWFSRFILGAKLRMGVVRRQNEALTATMVLAIVNLAELDWNRSGCEIERKEIEEVVTFMLLSFCAALRGEEVPLVEIGGLLKFWKETKEGPIPHIMVTLRGRFKAEKGLRWHCVPVGDATRHGSPIPLRRWLSRLMIRRVHKEGCKSGWLFAQKNGMKGRLAKYDESFKGYIGRVQERYPTVINPALEVNDFSLWRSGRRGAVTEATANMVDTKVIELINRWRSREAARGTESGLPMRQVYTQASNMLSTMIQYSQGLWVRAEGGFKILP